MEFYIHKFYMIKMILMPLVMFKWFMAQLNSLTHKICYTKIHLIQVASTQILLFC